MNYIKHLSGFFEKVSKDDRLNPTHISLYVSLFQFWNACRFHNPISISRSEAMKVSKICSKATYHKCIRELNDYGYLSYHPSYNPFKGSLVYLFNFRTGSEQAVNGSHTKNETRTEQALVPYINNTNNNKLQTEVNEATFQKIKSQKSNSNDKTASDHPMQQKEKKVASKKRNENSPEEKSTEKGRLRPVYEDIKAHFADKDRPEVEAEKFYNYFESNGWLVGGKTPMQNWKAATSNWMINSEKFSNGKTKLQAGKLHATGNKDYSEPL